MNAQAPSHASADLALAVYLEPYADRRSVLLLGHVDGPSAAQLERVATHLDIIDPSGRAPAAGDVPELPFDDELFDLVVVTDLTTLPDPRSQAVRELRRVLARDGILVVASEAGSKKRRPEGSLQDQLERLLAAEFRHVRMLAQTAMFGFTVSDLAATRAELTMDTSLTRETPERVERFIGVASDLALKLDPKLWVQVPAEPLAQPRGPEHDPRLVESLRQAEEEARRALTRESELVRELERERKAREAAEVSKERARALERKLLAIEADYDDAVSRVRYFESLLLEREAATQAEQDQRADLEREVEHARGEVDQLRSRLVELEADRVNARALAGAAGEELAESERRARDLAAELGNAQREAKRHEQIARDLLEELRGLEQRALVAVEQDARVSELEAERQRAIDRAMEAELARESAQMRVDELRALLESPPVAATPPQLPTPEGRLAELQEERAAEQEHMHSLRGERTGLFLRVREAEESLAALKAQAEAGERVLDSKLALAEARAQAAVEALGDAEQSLKSLRAQLDQREADAQHSPQVELLEEQLVRAERRIEALTRELDEADRFAEDHAQDAERIEELELALERARERTDQLDDEARGLQDALFAAKEKLKDQERALAEAQAVVATQRSDARGDAELAGRLEQMERRASELRAERDDVRAALAEARAILSQLAVRVGADTHDLPAIMQALEQQANSAASLDALRSALAEAQAKRSDVEYQLVRAQRQIEEREQRIRELEAAPRTTAEQSSLEPEV